MKLGARRMVVVGLTGAVLACAPVVNESAAPDAAHAASSGSSGGGVETGEVGGACYRDGSCNLGNVCSGGACSEDPRIRSNGGPCDGFGVCGAGLRCSAAMVCVPESMSSGGPGSEGQIPDGEEGGRCFGNNTCFSGLDCSGGTCVTGPPPQGELGGPCYGNATCNAGLECTGATCQPAVASSSSAPPSSSASSGGGGVSSSAPPPPPACDPVSGEHCSAREFFDQSVQPELLACAGCHRTNGQGPSFLGSSISGYYDSMTRYGAVTGVLGGVGLFIRYNPAQNSALVLKGAHAGPAFSSQGTPSARDQVIKWLQKEGAEHHLQPPPANPLGPSVTASAALSGFAKCLSATEFDAVNMPEVAHQPTPQGHCHQCHQTGQGGNYLSTNGDTNFTRLRTAPFILKFAAPSILADGSYTVVPSNRWRDHGGEPGSHPRYTMSGGRLSAIDSMFANTLQRYTQDTGGCRTSP